MSDRPNESKINMLKERYNILNQVLIKYQNNPQKIIQILESETSSDHDGQDEEIVPESPIHHEEISHFQPDMNRKALNPPSQSIEDLFTNNGSDANVYEYRDELWNQTFANNSFHNEDSEWNFSPKNNQTDELKFLSLGSEDDGYDY